MSIKTLDLTLESDVVDQPELAFTFVIKLEVDTASGEARWAYINWHLHQAWDDTKILFSGRGEPPMALVLKESDIEDLLIDVATEENMDEGEISDFTIPLLAA